MEANHQTAQNKLVNIFQSEHRESRSRSPGHSATKSKFQNPFLKISEVVKSEYIDLEKKDGSLPKRFNLSLKNQKGATNFSRPVKIERMKTGTDFRKGKTVNDLVKSAKKAADFFGSKKSCDQYKLQSQIKNSKRATGELKAVSEKMQSVTAVPKDHSVFERKKNLIVNLLIKAPKPSEKFSIRNVIKNISMKSKVSETHRPSENSHSRRPKMTLSFQQKKEETAINRNKIDEFVNNTKQPRHKKSCVSSPPAELAIYLEEVKDDERGSENRLQNSSTQLADTQALTNSNRMLCYENHKAGDLFKSLHPNTAQELQPKNICFASYVPESSQKIIEFPGNEDSRERSNKVSLKPSKNVSSNCSIVKRFGVDISKNLSSIEDFSQNFYNYYCLVEFLGEGSYAKVYKAKSTQCDMFVAVKQYDRAKISSERTHGRVVQEIQILKTMHHSNVIELIELFEDINYIYLVMEFADAGNLQQKTTQSRGLSEQLFLPIFYQILEGLNYIHKQGVLHRDIKLANILLTKRGKVKICDFGVSLWMGESKIIKELIGTPIYLAPEIVSGQGYSGFASDLWSLGILSYMMLFFQEPFDSADIDKLNQSILNQPIIIPDNHGISPQLSTVLSGLLEKNPAKRMSIPRICEVMGFSIRDALCPEERSPNEKIINRLKELGYSDLLKELEGKKSSHVRALYRLLEKEEERSITLPGQIL